MKDQDFEKSLNVVEEFLWEPFKKNVMGCFENTKPENI